MRTEYEIKKLILDFAEKDHRIRAVLLNGSRAIEGRPGDELQDFDIVYVVTELESFLSDHNWTSIFGEKLIWQIPYAMELDDVSAAKSPATFPYLMLFDDGIRIDLTLFPASGLLQGYFPDRQTLVWLDKDSLFRGILPPDERDYFVTKPSEKQFLDTCNEFWWVITYVSKGLVRNQIPYAKAVMEGPVRKMFMKMTAWKIGVENAFSFTIGKEGKYLMDLLPENEYRSLLKTYSDDSPENNWNAIFLMTEIFIKYANFVAEELEFHYNLKEQENAIAWLRGQLNKNAKSG